jgi:hypothetical protein
MPVGGRKSHSKAFTASAFIGQLLGVIADKR